jgi:hypothetical protein
MTSQDNSEPPRDRLDSQDEFRDFVRQSLQEAEPKDVLTGVQEKLRDRSQGKFYEDGWSTTKIAPISTYLITSLFMLVILGFVYAWLFSLSGTPKDVDLEPRPIQLLTD